MTKFIRALSPIKSSKAGVVEGSVGYVLLFNAGRNPVEFVVRLKGDQLEFSENGFLYEGGRSKDFKQIIEEVLAQERK